MIVAFQRDRIEALSNSGRHGVNLAPEMVRFGEPAVWRKRGGNKEWLVHSDPRITVEDVARVATILAKPQLIKKNYDTSARTESERKNGAGKVRADIDDSIKDWDRGVVGTETVTVTVSERVVLSYDSVSRGMFCIAWDETANDGLGECTEWEERFKQVPVYEQVDSGQTDENGDPVMVDKWVDVDYEETRDVYLTGQDIAELQGRQVKNWILVGDISSLVPVEEDDLP